MKQIKGDESVLQINSERGIGIQLFNLEKSSSVKRTFVWGFIDVHEFSNCKFFQLDASTASRNQIHQILSADRERARKKLAC
jgi:hypothetical protein